MMYIVNSRAKKTVANNFRSKTFFPHLYPVQCKLKVAKCLQDTDMFVLHENAQVEVGIINFEATELFSRILESLIDGANF